MNEKKTYIDYSTKKQKKIALSIYEEEDLVKQAKNGDKKALELIILNNKKMICKLIYPCQFNNRFDENDLFQEGITALIKGIQEYKAFKDYPFKKYIYFKINSRIKTYITTNYFAFNVPVYLKALFKKIEQLEQEVSETDTNKFPDIQYYAKKLNHSEDVIKRCLEIYDEYYDSYSVMEDNYAT